MRKSRRYSQIKREEWTAAKGSGTERVTHVHCERRKSEPLHLSGPVDACIEELTIIGNSQDIWIASGRLRGTNGGGCGVKNANSVGMR